LAAVIAAHEQRRLSGTPTFASPEQLRGDELDTRSDRYAVGSRCITFITGKVPFEAGTMVQLVAKVLEKPAPDVRSLRPGGVARRWLPYPSAVGQRTEPALAQLCASTHASCRESVA